MTSYVCSRHQHPLHHMGMTRPGPDDLAWHGGHQQRWKKAEPASSSCLSVRFQPSIVLYNTLVVYTAPQLIDLDMESRHVCLYIDALCKSVTCCLDVNSNWQREQEIYKDWKDQTTLIGNYIDQTFYSKIILYNKSKITNESTFAEDKDFTNW